jgi:hypothetical protein
MRNLARAAFVTSVLLVPFSLFGQMDCFLVRTLKVSRIEGRVFDPQGIPVSGSTVAILKDNKSMIAATTDGAGRFHLDTPAGEYWLRATHIGFKPATVPVRVRHGLLRLLPSRDVYLILGAGMFLPCPAGTLGEKEFQSTIENLKEAIEEHRTQK